LKSTEADLHVHFEDGAPAQINQLTRRISMRRLFLISLLALCSSPPVMTPGNLATPTSGAQSTGISRNMGKPVSGSAFHSKSMTVRYCENFLAHA
jgi:hypothetical protein